MQRLSMLKFRRMCEDSHFLFVTNQRGNSTVFNPNRICFRNEAGTICFNRVKAVNYYDESQAFGMVFGIVCGNGLDDGGEVVYKVIVDKKSKM